MKRVIKLKKRTTYRVELLDDDHKSLVGQALKASGLKTSPGMAWLAWAGASLAASDAEKLPDDLSKIREYFRAMKVSQRAKLRLIVTAL